MDTPKHSRPRYRRRAWQFWLPKRPVVAPTALRLTETSAELLRLGLPAFLGYVGENGLMPPLVLEGEFVDAGAHVQVDDDGEIWVFPAGVERW